jgi:DNA invertase Pin-like site-specific DNA recombinase
VLVVYSLSRLSRSVIDAARILEELREAGADLAVVDCQIDTSTASGKLVFNVICAIAQFESELISERIKASNSRTTAEKGYRTQGVQPAGWTYENGQRVKVAAEWLVIELVQKLSKQHKPGVVAELLEEKGVQTITQLRGVANASGWTAKKVYEILQKTKVVQ